MQPWLCTRISGGVFLSPTHRCLSPSPSRFWWSRSRPGGPGGSAGHSPSDGDMPLALRTSHLNHAVLLPFLQRSPWSYTLPQIFIQTDKLSTAFLIALALNWASLWVKSPVPFKMVSYLAFILASSSPNSLTAAPWNCLFKYTPFLILSQVHILGSREPIPSLLSPGCCSRLPPTAVEISACLSRAFVSGL